MKIVKTFQMKIDIFTAVKYRCILHGNVCAMNSDGLRNKESKRHSHTISRNKLRMHTNHSRALIGLELISKIG